MLRHLVICRVLLFSLIVCILDVHAKADPVLPAGKTYGGINDHNFELADCKCRLKVVPAEITGEYHIACGFGGCDDLGKYYACKNYGVYGCMVSENVVLACSNTMMKTSDTDFATQYADICVPPPTTSPDSWKFLVVDILIILSAVLLAIFIIIGVVKAYAGPSKRVMAKAKNAAVSEALAATKQELARSGFYETMASSGDKLRRSEAPLCMTNELSGICDDSSEKIDLDPSQPQSVIADSEAWNWDVYNFDCEDQT